MIQINNIFNTKTVNIHQGGSDEDIAYITIRTRENWEDAGVQADDLAKALEEALGWTVITEPLPEVTTTEEPWPRLLTVEDGEDGSYYAVEGTKAAVLRARALADLALAKALEQEHSVDEAEVERFEHLIGDIEKEHGYGTPELARYLVQAGARAPEEEEDK